VRRDGVLVAQYDYDANGNRVSAGTPGAPTYATYDSQDRLTRSGDTTYSYVGDGSLRQAVNSATGATTGYHYDGSGNLLGVTLGDGRQIDYVVDGLGRRVGKKVDGDLKQGFLYGDGQGPVARLGADGHVVSRFVYGTQTTTPEYMVQGGVTYRIVTDERGSVRMVVNADTGDVVQERRLRVFRAGRRSAHASRQSRPTVSRSGLLGLGHAARADRRPAEPRRRGVGVVADRLRLRVRRGGSRGSNGGDAAAHGGAATEATRASGPGVDRFLGAAGQGDDRSARFACHSRPLEVRIASARG
jgi:YD repeat-containing protein